MKLRSTLVFVLLVVSTVGLALPLVAASADCEEDGGLDCCVLDCTVCACCSQAPQTLLSELGRGASGEMYSRLGPEEIGKPRSPFSRDVLHVPLAAPVS
ncbi:MAG: hypothetical protein K8J08_21565 [Thermoanaerobaculia bacterium]|nr:hypothetical protein [Thermoanaerobaculia bacterium]